MYQGFSQVTERVSLVCDLVQRKIPSDFKPCSEIITLSKVLHFVFNYKWSFVIVTDVTTDKQRESL